jgi:FdhD protein
MCTTPETEKAPTRQRSAVALHPVRKVTPQGVEQIQDALAVERWLRVTLNGREVAALMCSPGHEEELGAGFALTQGFIRSRQDLLSVALRADAEDGDVVRIVVAVDLSLRMADRLAAQGSCAGVAYAEEDLPVLAGDQPVIAAAALRQMARSMAAAQEIYRRTGGTHGAGVFTAGGELVAVREDVGRHNAVDKAVGHCLLAEVPLEDKALVVTGRASREIAVKAVRAGVRILASVSAATDAGAQIAERCGLTLIAFLRERRMNVCTHPQRIDMGGGG